jgi:hypothetical protein
MNDKNPHTEGAGASVVNVVADAETLTIQQRVDAIAVDASEITCATSQIESLCAAIHHSLDDVFPEADRAKYQALSRVVDFALLVEATAARAMALAQKVECESRRIGGENADV